MSLNGSEAAVAFSYTPEISYRKRRSLFDIENVDNGVGILPLEHRQIA